MTRLSGIVSDSPRQSLGRNRTALGAAGGKFGRRWKIELMKTNALTPELLDRVDASNHAGKMQLAVLTA